MTDSPETVAFMTLFAQVRDRCEDDPGLLEAEALGNDDVKALCDELSLAAHVLQMNERRRRELFAAPVNPAFIRAWREYEDRYDAVIAFLWLSDLWPPSAAMDLARTPDLQSRWENADEEADDQSAGIEEALGFAEFNAAQDGRWDATQDGFIQRIQDGVAAWERLKDDTDFDLRGVFRRRALIPFVLIPRQVAARHAETQSMLKNLQHAHDAFVFGATYAALGLMRSILEAVLRDHYRAQGPDLVDRIRNARGRLPRGANEAALHRLRKLANAVLHLDHERDEGLQRMDDVRLEKEIVSLLFVLRALIEGARR